MGMAWFTLTFLQNFLPGSVRSNSNSSRGLLRVVEDGWSWLVGYSGNARQPSRFTGINVIGGGCVDGTLGCLVVYLVAACLIGV